MQITGVQKLNHHLNDSIVTLSVPNTHFLLWSRHIICAAQRSVTPTKQKTTTTRRPSVFLSHEIHRKFSKKIIRLSIGTFLACFFSTLNPLGYDPMKQLLQWAFPE